MRKIIILTWIFLGIVLADQALAQSTEDLRASVNKGIVKVMGGPISGTYSKLVWDLSVVTEDDDTLRVVPVLGKGAITAIEDLLYLKGIDVALAQSDVLDFFVSKEVYPNIRDHIHYITVLYNEEVHLVAGPEIQEISDLKGKKVSFGPGSSGGFMTASIIFDKLELDIEVLDLSHQEGLKRLRDGTIDAMVRVSGAPVSLFDDISWQDSLHLVPIPPIEGSYLETTLNSDQYPMLIAQGEEIKTLAVAAVLAAYNWPANHPRRDNIQLMVDQISKQLPALRQDPYHPKWNEVSIEKELPGWIRWSEK